MKREHLKRVTVSARFFLLTRAAKVSRKEFTICGTKARCGDRRTARRNVAAFRDKKDHEDGQSHAKRKRGAAAKGGARKCGARPNPTPEGEDARRAEVRSITRVTPSVFFRPLFPFLSVTSAVLALLLLSKGGFYMSRDTVKHVSITSYVPKSSKTSKKGSKSPKK